MADELPMAIERYLRAGGMIWGKVLSFICLTLLSVGVVACLSPFPLVFISHKFHNLLGLINSFGGNFQVSLMMK